MFIYKAVDSIPTIYVNGVNTSIGANTFITGGYRKAPFTPEGKILKFKEWKKKTEYDLFLKEQYAQENIKRASDYKKEGSRLLDSGTVS